MAKISQATLSEKLKLILHQDKIFLKTPASGADFLGAIIFGLIKAWKYSKSLARALGAILALAVVVQLKEKY